MPQNSWPATTAWPSQIQWPSPQFPSTVTPSFWMDGRQPMFQDLAGTTPAAIGDPLGRINEAAPLGSNWQAPNTGQRGRRDPSGARIEYTGTGLTGTQVLTRSAVAALPGTDCTLAVTYLTRDAAGAAQQGLLRAPGFGGIYTSNGAIVVTYNDFGANWSPTGVPAFKAGAHVTVVARYTATGLKASIMVNGIAYQDTGVFAVTGAVASNPFSIGLLQGADQGVYGTVGHAIGVNRAISDAETQALALFLDAQPVPVSYPTTAQLFAVQGDSIARNVPGTENYRAWCWTALQNLRATYPSCEMFNGAAGGAGAAGVINSALPYYSSTRARNVMVIAVGTNDLATGSSAGTCLAAILAQYDAALAAGWLPLIATILDRTGALSVSQVTFDANRLTVNNGILASGRSVIDMTGVAGVSANGSSAGANFIGDGVHPGTLGHALMEPVYRAAMLARAA